MNKKFFYIVLFFCLSVFSVFAEELDYFGANNFTDYLEELNLKLQKNWIPPDFSFGEKMTVRFQVLRDGTVLDTNIIQSSNNILFDESGLEAIRKSSPFDKFPLNSTKNSLTVQYTFSTNSIKTDKINEYYELSKKYENVEPKKALEYINLAIDKTEGNIEGYFLYKDKANLECKLGEHDLAKRSEEQYHNLSKKVNLKRIHSSKIIAEIEQTPYSYFYLAHSYDLAEDYPNAIKAIDKAISLTDLNNNYKRYREELLKKLYK